MHTSKHSLRVETLVMSYMSMTEVPSARLVLQSISNEKDVSVGCNRNFEAIVGRGLLVAM